MGSTSQGRFRAKAHLLLIAICLLVRLVEAQPEGSALSPNIFNLAEGRNIYATSTCGDGTEREEYCILGETTKEYIDGQVRLGQLCDYCDSKDSRKSHPARNAIENNQKYWQSPPLSRSTKYHDVNLTIDLGQEFHVAYVYFEMGISPRPGVWALERSVDSGKTYQPWQYFASDEAECVHYFGKNVEFNISRDDSVICETQYSKIIPFKYGEVHVPIIVGRPSQDSFTSSESLQNWSRATNIRLRLMRTKTLLADVMSIEQQDPTVTRRYFYSIRFIDVGGRCVCNGHASHCNPTRDGKLRCTCEHNTGGDQCDKCDDLYNQKEWKAASIDNPNKCEKCNCHEHAHSCVYNATVEKLGLSMDTNRQMRGGGVCVDCQHNTDGINCEKCKPGFYKQTGKDLEEKDICAQCPCVFQGIDSLRYSGECDDYTARCKYNVMYQESNCDQCSDGHYGYPQCRECDCFRNGTVGGLCQNDNKPCPCKENFGGRFCKECALGFYEYPKCKSCECQLSGVTEEVCSSNTGKCVCKPGFTGDKCEKCVDGQCVCFNGNLTEFTKDFYDRIFTYAHERIVTEGGNIGKFVEFVSDIKVKSLDPLLGLLEGLSKRGSDTTPPPTITTVG